MFQELARLLGLFSKENIPITLLKGAALALTLYSDSSLRPLTDLDLLVTQNEMHRASAILWREGYVPRDEMASGTSLSFAGEQTFARVRGGRLDIDLHNHILVSGGYRRRMPVAWFWDRTRPVEFQGAHAHTLDDTAQLLHLALHYALNHREARLIWSYDLALLLSTHGQEIEWDALVERVLAFGVEQPVRFALEATRTDWQVDLPPDVLTRLCRGATSTWASLEFAVARSRELEARALWDGLSMPGALAKARFIGRHLFPSPSYMLARYNVRDARLLPAYYVWRVVSGVFRFARSAVVTFAR
jgi:hypothetical protein